MTFNNGVVDSAFARVKAIRGAVQVAEDTPEEIAKSTLSMMRKILSVNRLHHNTLISAFFTVTPDLASELPPLVMHEEGWINIPILCAAELSTTMMIPRVIRVLVHVEWIQPYISPQHVYLPGTTAARPLGAKSSLIKSINL